MEGWRVIRLEIQKPVLENTETENRLVDSLQENENNFME